MMDQNMGIAAPQSQPALSGVQSFVAPLSQMPIEALLQEFNNPASRYPKFAVLTAMQKKQEQARMQQAMQGQMAMAQNAQQQQQPPIAQGILAGAQQLAAQDQMPTYNTGGVVALQVGGVSDENARREGESYEDYRKRITERRDIQNKQLLESTIGRLPEESPLKRLYRSFVPAPEKVEPAPPPAPRPVSIAEQEAADKAATAAEAARLKEKYPVPSYTLDDLLERKPPAQTTERKKTGIATVAPAPAVDPLEALKKEIEAAGRTELAGAKLSPEEDAARKARAALMESNLSAAKKEAEDLRAAAEERRQSVIGQAKRSILEDPEALFKMAGRIDTSRGMGLRSLAEAAGSELGRRREAIQAAEEKFAGEQKEIRALNAANRTFDLARLELQEAYASRDADRIRAAEKNVAAARTDFEKAKLEYGLKVREVSAKEASARAQMVSAARPTDFERKLALFKQDPAAFEAMFGTKEAQTLARVQQATSADPLLKKLADEAALNVPGAVERYNARYRELVAPIAPQLLIGGGGGQGGGALEAATAIVQGNK